MKTNHLLLEICLCVFSFQLQAQNITEGTYMSLFHVTHYTVSKKDNNTILIKPCQQFESQLSTNNETFEFKRLADTPQFGWNGGTQIILNIDSQSNILSFPNPINMNIPVKLMLLHPNNISPVNNVKTYYDKTDGGYSNARVLITDANQIKTGNCFIHSNPTEELNQYITGSFNGIYDGNLKATFNTNNTGVFLGLPMRWSIVSDHKGQIKKWEYPSGGFLIHLMIEFDGNTPIFVDKPSAGEKLAIIESLRYDKEEGTIEIRQMQRKL